MNRLRYQNSFCVFLDTSTPCDLTGERGETEDINQISVPSTELAVSNYRNWIELS